MSNPVEKAVSGIIPADILQAAIDANDHARISSMYLDQIEIIGRAILAERERCATIADSYRANPRYTDWPYSTACADVAKAIRGEQP